MKLILAEKLEYVGAVLFSMNELYDDTSQVILGKYAFKAYFFIAE